MMSKIIKRVMFGRRADDIGRGKVAKATAALMSDLALVEAHDMAVKVHEYLSSTNWQDYEDMTFLHGWTSDFVAVHGPAIRAAQKRISGE